MQAAPVMSTMHVAFCTHLSSPSAPSEYMGCKCGVSALAQDAASTLSPAFNVIDLISQLIVGLTMLCASAGRVGYRADSALCCIAA